MIHLMWTESVGDNQTELERIVHSLEAIRFYAATGVGASAARLPQSASLSWRISYPIGNSFVRR
jgi:hypothetical protein